MSREKNQTISGASILGIGMFLVFLILKLAEIGVVANWSWWWVTAPLWVPMAMTIVILIVLVIIKIVVVYNSK